MDTASCQFPEKEMTDFRIDPKINEFIQKNMELIESRQEYQFALKVQSMAKMRASKNREKEAEILLMAGIDVLVRDPKVEWRTCLQLFNPLAAVYMKNVELLTHSSQKRVISLLFSRNNPSIDDIELIKKLISKCGKNPSDHPFLTLSFIKHSVCNGDFHKAEKYAASLDQATSIGFVDKWASHPETTKQEIPALWCRMALAKTLLASLDEGEQIFRKVKENFSNDNAYLVFTGFLIKTIRLKSKEAYEVIQDSYKVFLSADPVFNSLYKSFGNKFFGIEKEKGGLMSLFQ